jgi:Cd2+/Zn2+-exporting ATPase
VTYHLGSHGYLEELGVGGGELEAVLGELEGRGQTPVALSDGNRVLGVLGVADRIRDEAAESLTALRRLGVEPLVVLTGDTPRTAEAVGRQAGADEVRAPLLPEEKLRAIRELVQRHGSAGMVGDGINDAPALAAATVGIAMAAAGSDAAIETADVALVREDLRGIPAAVRLGQRTRRIIRTNIALSLLTKAAFVVLAALGDATLWMAVAADMGTSLAVILNGMRLLGRDKGFPSLDPARTPCRTGCCGGEATGR